MFTVVIERKAQKEIAKIDRINREKIETAIQKLADNPRPHGYIKMRGADQYRIKVARVYRIIYTINDGILTVEVIRVAHRREAYE